MAVERTGSRYEMVSRRSLLKASAAIGAALVLPACANGDTEVFAGAVTDPVAQPTAPSADPTAVPTTAPVTPEPAAEATAPATTAPADPTATAAPTPTPAPTSTPEPTVAVAGEMVIAFTYTQGVGGKNERPYVAVWIENEAGELAETVALFYQQERRGNRWLDHLDRWWAVDQDRIGAGGVDDAATISSATREPGTYAVVWDGSIDGVMATPGNYFICIESAREEGPYSLIREPVVLAGTLAPVALPDQGELSAATVRIDV